MEKIKLLKKKKDYIVDTAYLLAPRGLGTGSAWSGFYPPGRPAWLLVFQLYGSPGMQSKVRRE